MMGKVRVFISSKQKEFRHERAEIFKILSAAPFVEPVQAEDWSPQTQPIYDTFASYVKASAIYVGLFGCIYSAPTEQEYRIAKEEPKRQILIYFRDCETRDAELQHLYAAISDPERGHSFKEYSAWADLEPYFLRHIEDAVGRMIANYLDVAKPQAARSEEEDFFAQRAASSIRRLGLPPAETADEAQYWSDQLTKTVDYFRHLRARL
jgi:hypothetical protein